MKATLTAGTWKVTLTGQDVIDDVLRDLKRLGLEHRVIGFSVKRRFFSETTTATLKVTIPAGLELGMKVW